MHFDDRLVTVLRLPASSEAMARIQYRQLIDLLGRLPGDAESEMIDAGLKRVEALGTRIPAADRARLLRQPLQPVTSPRLLALLAQSEPDVATAAITCARLSQADWLKLIPELPVRARGILRHRRDLGQEVDALLERLGIRDRGLPPAADAIVEPGSEPVLNLAPEDMIKPELLPSEATEPVNLRPVHGTEWSKAAAAARAGRAGSGKTGADAGIGAIVRRIEEFRRAREAHTFPEPANDAPRLPLGDLAAAAPGSPAAIDFETDQDGRISWADGPHAPSLVGLALAAHEASEITVPPGAASMRARGEDMATAIRHRLPLTAAFISISGAPAVSGEWQVDAIPRFDSRDGRFLGYCGRLRRPRRVAPQDARPGGNPTEADRMRQVLHELRTPANAIQVAAEIIQQQLYGPAPHEYRALAAAIAGDCAHILAGFEELDRLVKLESGALHLEPGECDLASILIETVARLTTWTEPRRSGFVLPADLDMATLPVHLDRVEAERLVWRLLAALAGTTAPDEVLAVTWTRESNQRIALRIALPAALASREEADLFRTPASERGQTLALSAGMFGLGFTLRLAAAEAAAAGGALQRDGNVLRLSLPALTGASAAHSSGCG